MTLVASMQYLKSILDGLAWPASMASLPSPPGNLSAHITSPNPNVVASSPNAYIWFLRGTENRDNAKYGAGTVPRASVQGGPSGTKATEHNIPIYVVWDAAQSDPNFATLFPGMIDAIRSVLRVSADPVMVTDPWTGEQSWLVDVGETMTYDLDLWALENQRIERWDCMLTVQVTEVFSA
jgi:hypothetical protein